MTTNIATPTTARTMLSDYFGPEWERRLNNLATVVNSYRTDDEEVLVIRHTEANDVHGYDDPVDVSNYRVLYDAWSEFDGLITSTWSNVDSIGLKLDAEAPADLIEVLDSLSDYPVLDDQAWSEVEQEMIAEHWESYGESDVVRAVESALGADITDDAREIIRSLVWDGILGYGCGGGYPTMIDCSACDFGYEAVAEFFATNRGQVVELSGREFDLTDSNIIIRSY